MYPLILVQTGRDSCHLQIALKVIAFINFNNASVNVGIPSMAELSNILE